MHVCVHTCVSHKNVWSKTFNVLNITVASSLVLDIRESDSHSSAMQSSDAFVAPFGVGEGALSWNMLNIQCIYSLQCGVV